MGVNKQSQRDWNGVHKQIHRAGKPSGRSYPALYIPLIHPHSHQRQAQAEHEGVPARQQQCEEGAPQWSGVREDAQYMSSRWEGQRKR